MNNPRDIEYLELWLLKLLLDSPDNLRMYTCGCSNYALIRLQCLSGAEIYWLPGCICDNSTSLLYDD